MLKQLRGSSLSLSFGVFFLLLLAARGLPGALRRLKARGGAVRDLHLHLHALETRLLFQRSPRAPVACASPGFIDSSLRNPSRGRAPVAQALARDSLGEREGERRLYSVIHTSYKIRQRKRDIAFKEPAGMLFKGAMCQSRHDRITLRLS